LIRIWQIKDWYLERMRSEETVPVHATVEKSLSTVVEERPENIHYWLRVEG